MRKRWMIWEFVMLVLASSLAGATQARSQAKVEQELRQIEHDGITATINRNVKFFDRLLVPDWVAIGPTGIVSNKAAVLANVGNTKFSMKSGQVTDISVRLLTNDVAVFTDVLRSEISNQGKIVTVTVRATEIFVWRDGHWMSAPVHETRIPYR